MTKKIPWMSKLREIARKNVRSRKSRPHLDRWDLIAQYHATFQRLMYTADFDGVKWEVTFYDDGNNGGKWRLEIEASFAKNQTRWMKAIHEARILANKKMRCWDGDMRFFSKFGESFMLEIQISTKRIQVIFRTQNWVKTFCKRHRIRHIDAKRKFRDFAGTIRYVQSKAISLDRIVNSVKKWA